MKKLLFLSFILISHLASADLRQAIENFEEGLYYHGEALKLENRYKEKNLVPKENTLKTKAKEFIEKSYNEFWTLRKMGSTLPIYYMQHCETLGYITNKQDVLWDKKILKAIADEKAENTRPFLRNGQYIHLDAIAIPPDLLNESEESTKSSILGCQIRGSTEIDEKCILIHKLYDHWESSRSVNFRAAHHLCINIVSFFKKLSEQTAKKSNFGRFLISLHKKDGSLNKDKLCKQYTDKVDKKNFKALDLFLDPGFIYWLNLDCRQSHIADLEDFEKRKAQTQKNPANKNKVIIEYYDGPSDEQLQHVNEVIETYKDNDIDKIYTDHFKTALDNDTKRQAFMHEAMTAFQNGHPQSFLDPKFTYPTDDIIDNYIRRAPICFFLAWNFSGLQTEGSSQIAAYFAFLGDVVFNCPESTTLFRLIHAPYVAAYPRNAINVTSHLYTAPIQDYLLMRDKDTEEAHEKIRHATSEGNKNYGIELASHMIHAPHHLSEIQEASPYINNCIAELSSTQKSYGYHSLQIFRHTYNIVWGTEDSFNTCHQLNQIHLDKKLHPIYKSPVKGMLAYLTHYGIGCKADPIKAQRLANTCDERSSWEDLINIEEKFEKLLDHDDISVMKWFYTTIENQNRHYSTHINDMDPRLMLKITFSWVGKNLEKIKKNPDFIKGFYAAMDQLYASSSDHEKRFRLFYLDMAKIAYHFPEMQPEKYLAKALENADPDAMLFKANALFFGKYGFAMANRDEALEQVKLLLDKIPSKKAAKKILWHLLNQELNHTQNLQNSDISMDEDEDNDEEISLITGTTEDSNTLSTSQQSTQNASTSSHVKKPKVKTRKTQPDEVTASYHINLSNTTVEDTEDSETPNFTVNPSAFEFIAMIWSAGQSKIHQYSVKDAAACLKNTGFTCDANDNATWKFVDSCKQIHTLSFHIPHGRKENKLYPAIQKRIKRCFERLGITPDNLTIKK